MSTNPFVEGRSTRFHEADSANLIVRFRRWDNMVMVRPDSREGGFVPILTRDELEARLQQQKSRRDLAVVIVPNLCWESTEATLPAEWQQLAFHYGFHRLVILRTNGATDDVDGLPVAYDSAKLAVTTQSPGSALVVR